jgi:UDP-N-acetylglucosamine--N-acetylmuramyl-(pentapeptide) pyrophosphoryl-undecaprenol N-acetylglucosamine transferase
LPGAPGDHQTRNAEALVAAGAAILVPDAECTGSRLATELEPLLVDRARLERMAAAARTLAKPHAADDLAALVEAAAARQPFSLDDRRENGDTLAGSRDGGPA